jgi:NitT/TauT family transport system substrate-binding protein
MEGGGRLFLEESTLWDGGKYVTTHLIVARKFLEQNPQLLKKLVSAHIEVTQKINSDKKAAAAILNEQLKKETGKAVRDDVLQQAMSRVEFAWDPVTASLKKEADAAFETGFVKQRPELSGIYSLQTLNDVLKEKQLDPVH